MRTITRPWSLRAIRAVFVSGIRRADLNLIALRALFWTEKALRDRSIWQCLAVRRRRLGRREHEVDGRRHDDRDRPAVQDRRRELPLADRFERRFIKQRNRTQD